MHVVYIAKCSIHPSDIGIQLECIWSMSSFNGRQFQTFFLEPFLAIEFLLTPVSCNWLPCVMNS